MAKGWLDNYGTKANENNSSVSLPEGFVGMGNNTKGRNYSPAWGGSFQMGGSVYPVNYVPQAQNGFDAKAFQKTLDDKFAKDKQSRSKKSSNVKLKDTRNAVVDETSTKPVVNERLKLKELKDVNANQNKIEDAKDYYKQYLNSPKAKERIANMIDYRSDPEYDRLFPEEKNSAVDQEIKNRLEGLNKLKGKFDYIDDVGTYSSSYYEPKTNSLFIRPNSDANISYVNGDENQWDSRIDIPNTIGHELGHGIQRVSNKDSNNLWYRNGISKKESNLLMHANIGLMRSKNRDAVLKDKDNPEYKYDLDHDNKPSELKADIDALRYQLHRQGVYDPGTQDFTREHLEKAKPSFTRSRLNEHFTDDDLINLMNKLSYNERNDDGITPIAQMGGSLPGATGHMYARYEQGGKVPGAVGFSYARTQSPAPSNGKYAKKTMASAQNGSWLSKYDVAQTGTKKFKLKDERDLAYKPAESTNIKKKNFDLEQDKERKNYLSQLADQQKENSRRKKLTQDQREREDYNARNEERGSIQAHVPESTWDRSKAIASNPLTAFGYAARNQSLPARFQHGERNVLDNAIDWINPLQGVASASEIPGEIGRGEYLNAGLSLLDAADLGVYAKGAMKVSKPLLQKAGQQLGNMSTNIAPELRQGLQTAGITGDLATSVKSGIKKGGQFITDAMNKKIGPEFNRRILPDNIETFAEDYGYGKTVGFKKAGSSGSKHHDDVLGYLDLNKRTTTVYNPTSFMYENATPEWFKPGMIEVKKNMQGNQMQDALYQLGINEAKNQGLKGIVSGETLLSPAKTAKAHQRFEREILGTTTTNGVDHDISALTQHMNPNVVEEFMKKYESLPKHIKQQYSLKEYIKMSGESLTNLARTEISPKGAAAIIGIPVTAVAGGIGKSIYDANELQNEMDESNKKYQEESDIYDRENKTQTTKYYDGGIIKDDRGQWDHPGEITEIGSNDITMEGVPYDVLGVSDTGDVKMMKPGKNYKFKGKKVTEYPMAKNGLRQEQKGLQNLDNLTNFTNYNKPQPGGWLNKYN